MRRDALVVCLLTGLSILSSAQQPSLRTATTTILFDVVARDRKGAPVRDLAVADFELSEDGSRQAITAVFGPGGRPLDTPAAPSGTTPGAATTAEPAVPQSGESRAPAGDVSPSVVAFVFDQLSPEARPMAARVADAMLAGMPTRDWVGLFALEHRLHIAQDFTQDRTAARTALSALAQRPIVGKDASATQSTRTGIDLDPSVSATVGAESRGGAQDFATRQRLLNGAGPERLLYAMEMRMAETYERYTRDVQGQMAAVGLRAIATGMAGLTGRKAVVLFSEGLPLSDQARTLFDTMVAAANRAGVTFYPVDAAGLRAHSTVAAAAREQDYAGRVALGDEGRSQGAWTRDLEKQADLVRSDGTASLSRLAKETGGLLLENTNNVERIAKRIAEDQASHYLLAYTPARGEMDGTYRRVTVKVKRKGTSATHRSGYWAVATTP
ncbi:VWA domain-containing protein [Luteitalea sp.]|uniref:VWA domain-containing protein n=1 Tax=Luteitalea sp. TaxID=2004800 RepID=UPI0025BE0DF7|nr:VWA domain-containing protein [Luteitalea sp.]